MGSGLFVALLFGCIPWFFKNFLVIFYNIHSCVDGGAANGNDSIDGQASYFTYCARNIAG